MVRKLRVNGKGYRATSKWLYKKTNRNAGGKYKRYGRGTYRRPYNALKWVKMMRHPYGRKNYPWRLRSNLKNWWKPNKDTIRNFHKLPKDLQNYIRKFAGESKGRSARGIKNSWY